MYSLLQVLCEYFAVISTIDANQNGSCSWKKSVANKGKSCDPEVTELKSKPWITKIYLRFPPPTIIFKILLIKVHECLPCIMYRISYCIMFYYISIKHIEIRQNSPLTPPPLLVPGPCLSSQIHMLVVLVHVSIPFFLNLHPRNIPALLCFFTKNTLYASF